MRILVISDTHGNTRRLYEAIDAQPEARYVLFLGDGLRDADEAARRYPDREIWSVSGNCDAGAILWNAPIEREETLGGRRIFFTHGHRYDVKYGLDRLEAEARARGAQIALYGHTHRAETHYADGLYVMNPGSLGAGMPPSYGVVDIVPSGVMLTVVPVR